MSFKEQNTEQMEQNTVPATKKDGSTADSQNSELSLFSNQFLKRKNLDCGGEVTPHTYASLTALMSPRKKHSMKSKP